MDGLFRFSDYDVFGYLISGLALIAICDVTFGTQFVLASPGWTVFNAVAIIVAGYVVGHIVAATATLVIDRFLISFTVGNAANRLMMWKDKGWKPGWRRLVLGEYFVPVHWSVWERAVKRAGLSPDQERRNEKLGELVFWPAWAYIKQQPIPYARMDSFLRLYGFCRQCCFVSLIAALAFAYRIWLPISSPAAQPTIWWVVLAVVTAFAMFNRYLKFLRAYSLEVFITFADG
jgi:hypothetical protein